MSDPSPGVGGLGLVCSIGFLLLGLFAWWYFRWWAQLLDFGSALGRMPIWYQLVGPAAQ